MKYGWGGLLMWEYKWVACHEENCDRWYVDGTYHMF